MLSGFGLFSVLLILDCYIEVWCNEVINTFLSKGNQGVGHWRGSNILYVKLEPRKELKCAICEIYEVRLHTSKHLQHKCILYGDSMKRFSTSLVDSIFALYCTSCQILSFCICLPLFNRLFLRPFFVNVSKRARNAKALPQGCHDNLFVTVFFSVNSICVRFDLAKPFSSVNLSHFMCSVFALICFLSLLSSKILTQACSCVIMLPIMKWS